MLNVKTLMVINDNGKKYGKSHKIFLTRTKGDMHHIKGQEDVIVPSDLHEKDKTSVIDTLKRVRSFKGIKNLFSIELNFDDLDDQNGLKGLTSLELSLGIGMIACCNWAEWWPNNWKKWCFSGAIVGDEYKVTKSGDITTKLEHALFEDDGIKYFVIPCENEEEVKHWLCDNEKVKKRCKSFETNDFSKIDNYSSTFFKRIWCTAKKKVLLSWTALIFLVLSALYVPIKFFAWDYAISFTTGIPHATLKLPLSNIDKTKEKLLNRGFPAEITNYFLSSSIINNKQKKSEIIKLRDKEIIAFVDYTSLCKTADIASYLGIAFIVFIPVVFIIPVLIRGGKDFEHNNKGLSVDSITIKKTDNKEMEIIFVRNINEAEAIVKYKINK